MTKYFELQETPELKYAPRIKNLFGKFDIRTIQLETYPKIPDRQVFIVEPSNKTFPTHQLQRKSQLYFLPVFNETKALCVESKEYDNGKNISKQTKQQGEKVFVNKNIFWVSDSLKRHTILSMDIAESLIRREVFGLGLKEVELYRETEERSILR